VTFHEFPTETHLLAADVIQLEDELVKVQQDLRIAREMISILLTQLNEAFELLAARGDSE